MNGFLIIACGYGFVDVEELEFAQVGSSWGNR